MNTWQTLEKTYTTIIVKSWLDIRFKARLLHEPALVLKEQGIDIPEGTAVSIIEGATVIEWCLDPTPTLLLPLPSPPSRHVGKDFPGDAASLEISLCASPCCSCCCG